MTPDEHRAEGLRLLRQADAVRACLRDPDPAAQAALYAGATAHLTAAALPDPMHAARMRMGIPVAQAAPGTHERDALYAEVEAERDDLRVENEQLRYERRLLGAARMILDRAAEYDNLTPEDRPILRREAADVAQRIVDEIGHPVTDEPALGPSMRETLALLDAAAASVWLYGKWRWLTQNMTTAQREAFADAVDRDIARGNAEDGDPVAIRPVDRWWRNEPRRSLDDTYATGTPAADALAAESKQLMDRRYSDG